VRLQSIFPTQAHGPGSSAEDYELRFSWNIRELRNLLERAHILGQREEIAAEELPVGDTGHTTPKPESMEMRDWLRTLPANVDLRELLTDFEKGPD
jgi:DNA-binding NtrC family response regulator